MVRIEKGTYVISLEVQKNGTPEDVRTALKKTLNTDIKKQPGERTYPEYQTTLIMILNMLTEKDTTK